MNVVRLKLPSRYATRENYLGLARIETDGRTGYQLNTGLESFYDSRVIDFYISLST